MSPPAVVDCTVAVAALACPSDEEVALVVPLLVLAPVLADVVLVVVVVSAVVELVAVSAAAAVEEEVVVDPESLPPQPASAIVTLPNNAGQATWPVRVTFFMRPRKK